MVPPCTHAHQATCHPSPASFSQQTSLGGSSREFHEDQGFGALALSAPGLCAFAPVRCPHTVAEAYCA